MTEPATNPEDDIRDFLARDLAEGFNDPADIAESALDYFGDEIDESFGEIACEEVADLVFGVCRRFGHRRLTAAKRQIGSTARSE